ncbi:MAG: HNH endonuclease [Mycobacterium sp.]
MLQRDGHQCVGRGPRCLVTASEVDHIQPVAEGGTDDMSNLVSVCKACHAAKTAEDHERHADEDQRQSSISSTRQCDGCHNPLGRGRLPEGVC